MRIAITGGTGFVGSHLAARLRAAGTTVIVSRRTGSLDRPARRWPPRSGLRAVVHCAGINRELGAQTYARSTSRARVPSSRPPERPGSSVSSMLSFLRARPDGPTAYHGSKWAAEELVRAPGWPGRS